ncbi:hypothetical protein FQZ97_1204480 [compost metagenome]
MKTRKILFGLVFVVSSLFLFGESRADVAHGCSYTGEMGDSCRIVIPGYGVTILGCKPEIGGETCNYDFTVPVVVP